MVVGGSSISLLFDSSSTEANTLLLVGHFTLASVFQIGYIGTKLAFCCTVRGWSEILLSWV